MSSSLKKKISLLPVDEVLKASLTQVLAESYRAAISDSIKRGLVKSKKNKARLATTKK